MITIDFDPAVVVCSFCAVVVVVTILSELLRPRPPLEGRRGRVKTGLFTNVTPEEHRRQRRQAWWRHYWVEPGDMDD